MATNLIHLRRWVLEAVDGTPTAWQPDSSEMVFAEYFCHPGMLASEGEDWRRDLYGVVGNDTVYLHCPQGVEKLRPWEKDIAEAPPELRVGQ